MVEPHWKECFVKPMLDGSTRQPKKDVAVGLLELFYLLVPNASDYIKTEVYSLVD